jgi:6-phosphogluconolactonase
LHAIESGSRDTLDATSHETKRALQCEDPGHIFLGKVTLAADSYSSHGGSMMTLQIFADADTVAKEAAKLIATEARQTVTERGRFILAVSGGRTPWRMLRALPNEEVPWKDVHVAQVDERIAPAGDPDRNLTHLQESLLQQAPLPREQIYPMPVEDGDMEAAAEKYARILQRIAGTPPVLDLAHLGLGPDGHTASLVPNDPVLNVVDRDIALTGVYLQRRRMTLTYPILNRSRRILWVVTGAEKVTMLPRLLAADASIPAGRVRQEQALVLADRAAAKNL